MDIIEGNFAPRYDYIKQTVLIRACDRAEPNTTTRQYGPGREFRTELPSDDKTKAIFSIKLINRTK